MDYEQGSAAGLARLMTRTVPTDENLLMPVHEVKRLIRKIHDDQAPRTCIL